MGIRNIASSAALLLTTFAGAAGAQTVAPQITTKPSTAPFSSLFLGKPTSECSSSKQPVENGKDGAYKISQSRFFNAPGDGIDRLIMTSEQASSYGGSGSVRFDFQAANMDTAQVRAAIQNYCSTQVLPDMEASKKIAPQGGTIFEHKYGYGYVY